MSKGVYKNSVEHKYSYSGMQYYTKAYGWSSTKNHVGTWFINPTIEYLSGGPTRTGSGRALWRQRESRSRSFSIIGTAATTAARRFQIAAGEEWTKVVGPIFVYVNSLDETEACHAGGTGYADGYGGEPDCPRELDRERERAMAETRRASAKKQNAEWPYGWVKGVDYTPLTSAAL